MDKIPIAVELTATHDRSCVIIVFRSNEKIRMDQLVPALETFTAQLKEKFAASKIERVPKPQIIMP